MQIGFVGLGRMGGNMVARILRDSDHEVVAFDFRRGAVQRGRGPAPRPPRRSRSSSRKLEPPRDRLADGPGGRSDPVDGRHARAGCWTPGDTIVDGGNSRWTDDKARAEALAPNGHPLRRRRHERRRLGPRAGLLHDGRRARRGGRAARAVPRRAGAAADDEHGPAGGNGPAGAGHYVKMVHNGDRVRDDAGLRRGLRRSSTPASTSSTTRRSPTSGCRARSSARGSASSPRARSSRRATTSPASSPTSRTPARAAGRSRTSIERADPDCR